ncbi:MAG: hypothetical protein LBI86_02650 [Treponema sp.]|jgi:hypothetical protein|nr:hypothetical protein [Treponema sp.]
MKPKSRPGAVRPFAAALIAFAISACGIEDYYYLETIPVGNVFRSLANTVEVYLPNYSSVGYFTNFSIYYHIYTSSYLELSTITEGYNFSFISGELQSHYNSIRPYTSSDSISGISIDSIFRNYRYYTLELQNADIDLVLNGGSRLVIDFPDPGIPSLTIISPTLASYSDIILRSNTFTHQPDRFFNDDVNLIAQANININPDVSGGVNPHRYVSLYIVAAGQDQQNLNMIYSNPTWLGLFRLKSR